MPRNGEIPRFPPFTLRFSAVAHFVGFCFGAGRFNVPIGLSSGVGFIHLLVLDELSAG